MLLPKIFVCALQWILISSSPSTNQYTTTYDDQSVAVGSRPLVVKRQVPTLPISPFICGIPPYRFRADYPCQYYAVCINGGFRTNVPCTDSYSCQQSNPDTVCVEGTCCTLPMIIAPIPTTSPFPPIMVMPRPGSGAVRVGSTMILATLLVVVGQLLIGWII